MMIWDNVPSDLILEKFIDEYNETEGQISDSSALGEQKLILELNKYDELTNWTVGFYLGGSVANTSSNFNINSRKIEFCAMKEVGDMDPNLLVITKNGMEELNL